MKPIFSKDELLAFNNLKKYNFIKILPADKGNATVGNIKYYRL